MSTKLYRKKTVRRTKDKGLTRRGVLGMLGTWDTIPELKRAFRRHNMPMDVSIETAIKNALADGLIEVLPIKYSAYDAKRYQVRDSLF